MQICMPAFRFRPVLDQNLFYTGTKLTSAGFASGLINILPAVTFLMAILLRTEKVKLRRLHSQAKIVGTVFTFAGAVLMIMFHGPVVQFPWSKGHHHGTAGASQKSGATWINGTVMVAASCVCWSGFFILQVSHPTIAAFALSLRVQNGKRMN